MSIDLDWETLTSGPDGDALAERIRTFIHDKFQTVPLPRFIRSVNVHDFDFGSIPPELDLKDITDPLSDFYDQEIADDESDDEFGSDDEAAAHLAAERAKHALAGSHDKRPRGIRPPALRHDMFGHDSGSLFLGTSAPGILGGPGLNYFQSHLGTGTHTPLAAVAGAHLGNNSWMGHGGVLDHEGVLDHDSDFHHHHQQHHHHHHQQHHNYHHGASHYRNPSASSISVDNFSETMDAATDLSLREKSSVSTLAPTSVNTSRPPTRDRHLTGSAVEEADEDEDEDEEENPADGDDLAAQQRREPRAEDVQAVFRIRYAGDVRLSLTAEILLDYPMPSFVGIPLKLNITGLSFDGVGLLAKIRKRVHFCFLSPEDALAAVGSVNDDENVQGEEEKNGGKKEGGRLGGLLQEIKVESEIGERDGGKQSLKNVGKVERFVLEQVRRIFEEEFVYPSFWTFLV